MAEIVNLRRVKKARAKAGAEAQAAENRARHGRTRAERNAIDAESRRLNHTLDAAALPGDGKPRE